MVTKMGRARKFASSALRQKMYRERKKAAVRKAAEAASGGPEAGTLVGRARTRKVEGRKVILGSVK